MEQSKLVRFSPVSAAMASSTGGGRKEPVQPPPFSAVPPGHRATMPGLSKAKIDQMRNKKVVANTQTLRLQGVEPTCELAPFKRCTACCF